MSGLVRRKSMNFSYVYNTECSIGVAVSRVSYHFSVFVTLIRTWTVLLFCLCGIDSVFLAVLCDTF